MRIVNVSICIPDSYSEVPVDDVDSTAYTIESLVGPPLSEAFDVVHIEDVTVRYVPEHGDEDGERW